MRKPKENRNQLRLPWIKKRAKCNSYTISNPDSNYLNDSLPKFGVVKICIKTWVAHRRVCNLYASRKITNMRPSSMWVKISLLAWLRISRFMMKLIQNIRKPLVHPKRGRRLIGMKVHLLACKQREHFYLNKDSILIYQTKRFGSMKAHITKVLSNRAKSQEANQKRRATKKRVQMFPPNTTSPMRKIWKATQLKEMSVWFSIIASVRKKTFWQTLKRMQKDQVSQN